MKIVNRISVLFGDIERKLKMIRDGFCEYNEYIYWGTTIDNAVKALQECNNKGLKRYIKFNGSILYSDTVTLNSAYEEITGKNYKDFNKEQEEYFENLKKADEDHKEKIPELTQLYIQKGHKIIDSKYWDEWDRCVPARLNDLYKGMELQMTLDLVQMLNDNKTFKEVSEALDAQGHSGISYGLMKSMLRAFHDKGQEFVNTLS